MSTKRILLGVCSLATLLAAPRAAAQPVGAFLDTGLSRTSPSGTAAFRSPDDGAAFRASALLGSESAVEALPSLRMIWPKYRVEVSYRQSSFNGALAGPELARSTLSSPLLFGSLAVDHFSAGFRRSVLDTPHLSIGLGADVDRLRLESITRSPVPAFGEQSETRVFGAPVATFGFNLHDLDSRAFFDLKLGYTSFTQTEFAKARAEVGYGLLKHAGVKAAWEGLRFQDRGGSARPEVDLKLSTFSGGFYFSF